MSLWNCTSHFESDNLEDAIDTACFRKNPRPYLPDPPYKKHSKVKTVIVSIVATAVILINILMLTVSLFLSKQVYENMSGYYVYITDKGMNYHEADCGLIMNHDIVTMDLTTALKLGFKQCVYCRKRIIYFFD